MKKIISSILVVSTVFLFSGCSSKSSFVKMPSNKQACKTMKIDEKVCNDSAKKDLYYVFGVSSFSAYGMTHKIVNNANYAVIQAAAEATKKLGKNYFSIVAPKHVSNIDGSLINTAEGFIKECSTNIGKVLTFQKDPCRLQPKVKGGARMVIAVYDRQPTGWLSYNADKVIAYLKKEGLYDEKYKVGKISEVSDRYK